MLMIYRCAYIYEKKTNETIINIRLWHHKICKNLLRYYLSKQQCSNLVRKSKPNGTPRKVMNVNLAKKYGWKAKTNIKKAINITYKDC